MHAEYILNNPKFNKKTKTSISTGKRFERPFYQGGYMGGKEAREKMLDISREMQIENHKRVHISQNAED